MGYFKRNISPSQSEQLCSWDGKGAACEARGCGFKSQRKNILSHFGGLRYRLFYPVPNTWAIGTTFGVPVQETGTKGQSQPVPMALFLVVTSCLVRTSLTISPTQHLWWEHSYFSFEITHVWLFLVPDGNTTRYQRLDIGTGWCWSP